MYATFIGLLQKFEISFQMRGEPVRYLLPSLLPETAPAELSNLWAHYPSDHQLQYGRRYSFTFLPAGLFGRVLVRILHIPNTDPVLLWRNGALIALPETSQLTLLQYDTIKFTLTVTVRAPHGVTPMLREVIAEIDQPLEGTSPAACFESPPFLCVLSVN